MAFILPFIPLIAAGIGAAVTGVELASRPEAPKPESVTPVVAQTKQAGADQAAALAQAQALQKRRGMAATVLTSPTGVTSSTTTQSATLGT